MIKIEADLKKQDNDFSHLLKPAKDLNVGEVFISEFYLRDVINGVPVLREGGYYAMALFLHSDRDVVCYCFDDSTYDPLEEPHDQDSDQVCTLSTFSYIGRNDLVLPVDLTVTKVKAAKYANTI